MTIQNFQVAFTNSSCPLLYLLLCSLVAPARTSTQTMGGWSDNHDSRQGKYTSFGSGSRYFGWIRIRVFWSDQDPGVLVGSGSGWFGRISIRVVWSDQDPGGMVLSGSVFGKVSMRIRSEHPYSKLL